MKISDVSEWLDEALAVLASGMPRLSHVVDEHSVNQS